MITDLVANGEQYNLEWLLGHKEHHLYHAYCIIHAQNNQFAFTSCEVTAEMIKSRLLGDQLLNLLEISDYNTVSATYPFFQMTFGEEWSDTQHVLTIYEGYILQSYYKKYKLRAVKIDETLKELLQNPVENYSIITDVKSESDSLQVWFWVPLEKLNPGTLLGDESMKNTGPISPCSKQPSKGKRAKGGFRVNVLGNLEGPA